MTATWHHSLTTNVYQHPRKIGLVCNRVCMYQGDDEEEDPGIDIEVFSSPLDDGNQPSQDRGNKEADEDEGLQLVLDEELDRLCQSVYACPSH